ncbi:uncharacterized protein LOC119604548 isoform X1 [Lucilia sericata]|uniref:uncharacterized protein LOC119604548 isoform X1 n=2 Tax=Lucilia sericata TaxID=13632 RepID=UPI0018A8753E|nr:uncharacterized protein LOC119604548 isoform X1 [Lucilia sericata]
MLHYQQNEQYPQLLPSNRQQQQQQQQQVPVLKVYYLRLNSKEDGSKAAACLFDNNNSSSNSSRNTNTTMKTLAPNIRRRRRCDRHHLELYHGGEGGHKASSSSTSSPTTEFPPKSKSASTSPISDLGIPAPPITPPPAFLSEGYRRSTTPSKSAAVKRSLGMSILILFEFSFFKQVLNLNKCNKSFKNFFISFKFIDKNLFKGNSLNTKI